MILPVNGYKIYSCILAQTKFFQEPTELYYHKIMYYFPISNSTLTKKNDMYWYLYKQQVLRSGKSKPKDASPSWRHYSSKLSNEI